MGEESSVLGADSSFQSSPAGAAARATPRLVLLAVLAGLILLVAVTRIPLAPRHLFLFDNVNLALALDEFDPRLHQPQPPGYPLFVVEARLIRTVFDTPERTFLVCGLLAAALAPFFLFLLGTRMYSRWTGMAAALLLAVNPAFWCASLTSPLRPYIALVDAAGAYLCWKAVSNPRFAYYAAVAIGLGGGWRPAAMALLLPLWLVCAWIGLRSFRRMALALALLAAAMLAWLVPLTVVLDGPAGLYGLFSSYLAEQSQDTSPIYGAGFWDWSRTMVQALVWQALAVVGWFWALLLLLLPRREASTGSRAVPVPGTAGVRSLPKWLFFVMWLAPPAIFFKLVHVASPGHTLAIDCGLCLLGAACLEAAAGRASRFLPGRVWPRTAFLTVALAVNLAFFWFPYRIPRPRPTQGNVARLAEQFRFWGYLALRTSSYTAIQAEDTATRACLSFIRAQGKARPLAIVWQDDGVSWRKVAYYFSDEPVWMIEGLNGLDSKPAIVPWLWFSNRIIEAPGPEPPVRLGLPAGGRVVWLVHVLSPLPKELRAQGVPLRQFGKGMFVTDLAGAPAEFRAAQFVFQQKRDFAAD